MRALYLIINLPKTLLFPTLHAGFSDHPAVSEGTRLVAIPLDCDCVHHPKRCRVYRKAGATDTFQSCG